MTCRRKCPVRCEKKREIIPRTLLLVAEGRAAEVSTFSYDDTLSSDLLSDSSGELSLAGAR